MKSVIGVPRTIVPACDVSLSRFKELVSATGDIDKIGAYKIGFALGLAHGLKTVVDAAREFTDKPLIYDHQKAGTDIPETGSLFANIIADAGFAAVILFPQAGPVTLRAWVKAAESKGLRVIVGGRMTHEGYVLSEGGYLADEAVERIYTDAAHLGVTDFVVPGNQPEFIRRVRDILVCAGVEPVFYAPGFVAQKGQISEAAKAAGPRWHAIVGRAIYDSPDMQRATLELAASI